MEDAYIRPLDYLSILRRRKWWLVAPLAASVLVGLALVRYLPKEYKASTTLGVAAPMVSPNLVNQATPFDNEERLRALSLQLLSVPILTRVAQEEHLVSGGPTEPVVAGLRHAIEITVPEPISATGEARHLDAFVLSYAHRDPGTAQRIANRLATVFLDENSKTRTERAEGTSAFLLEQLRDSQGRLKELEARLRQSKESYMGQLPEQTQANLQALAATRQQLEAHSIALRNEQDRLSVIERQLESMRPAGKDGVPTALREEETAGAADLRITTLEHDLVTARTSYTDKHPEVQRLQDELTAARRDAAAERQRRSALTQVQIDPASRQLTADRDLARLRIRELQRAAAEAQQQVSFYRSRVEATPMVEQQLATVQRDYDLEKQRYADLSAKAHAATLAESIERNQGSEQFTIVYPAAFPTEPTKPLPGRVMLVAILAGLVIGGALALGREYFDRSVHGVRDLRDEFDIPVLGEVARIQSA